MNDFHALKNHHLFFHIEQSLDLDGQTHFQLMFSAASLSNSSSRSSSNSAASLLVHTFRRRNCRSLQRKPILTNPVAYLFSLTLLGQTSTSFTTGWGPSVTAHNSRLTRVAAGDGLRQQYKQVFRSLGACTMSTVAAVATPKFVVAACQIMCSEDKAENIKTAAQAVEDAAAQGAQVCVIDSCAMRGCVCEMMAWWRWQV